ASLIDRRWRIPPRGWRIWINISHSAVFPKHGVIGRTSSNSLVADTRDAHDFTIIVDRRGGARGVAVIQSEVVGLVGWSGLPHGCAEREDWVARRATCATA